MTNEHYNVLKYLALLTNVNLNWGSKVILNLFLGLITNENIIFMSKIVR